MSEVKIITVNVNGIEGYKEMFLSFLLDSQADIFCIQETRVLAEKVGILKPDGYNNFANDTVDKHSGCAVYYTNEPIMMSKNFPESIGEGRMLAVEYKGFYLINIYLPNAGDNLQSLNEKIKAMQWLTTFSQKLAAKKPTIIAGDFNVATYYKDEVRRKQHKAGAGFNKYEQGMFKNLLQQGFSDVLTHQYKSEEELVAYLDATGNDNISNRHRLDYILVTENLLDKIVSVDVHTEMQRSEGDMHLPIELVLKL